MKQEFLKSLIVIACLFISINANAFDFEVDGIYYNIESETELTVRVTFKGTLTDWLDNSYIGEVIIPETVTYSNKTFRVTIIEKSAFLQSGELSSVQIPSSVETIYPGAFGSNPSLKQIIVEDGNSNYAAKDGVLFNKDFTELVAYPEGKSSTYTIPDNVEIIGWAAFNNNYSLTSVIIPCSVTTISKTAFIACGNLTSIIIPNSVKTIDLFAFGHCIRLTSVTIPNSVTEIGDGTFFGCYNITKINSISPIAPDVTESGANLFDNNVFAKATLNVPIGASASYRSADGWKNFVNINEVDFSGVESVNNNDIKVIAIGNEIILNGIDENMLIEIYNLNGQTIYTGTDNAVTMPTSGFYIVKIAGKTYKIAFK